MTSTAIPPVGTSTYSASTGTTTPKQTMDSSVFMQLLVSQLRNQDPSTPMDTNAMLEQTTQLASMEQLTSLTNTSTENFSLNMRAAAAALLGKTVSYADADGVPVSGTVSSVSFADKVPVVTVGTTKIRLDALLGVDA